MAKKMPKQKAKKLAKAEVISLFAEAKRVFKKSPSMANKHIAKARRLAMKHKLRFPRELKRRFCKHCYAYLVPGTNCRIRTQKGRVIYYCLNCKKFMRFVIKKKA